MRERLWTVLLILNILVPALGGIVLFAFPKFVPSTVNIAIQPNQYLLSYLIAGAEFAFAFACFYALKSPIIDIRRLVAILAIIFHGGAGFATLLAWLGGTDPAVLINTAARVVMVFLFAWLGLGRADRSNVEVGDGEGVLLDELAARFDHIAH